MDIREFNTYITKGGLIRDSYLMSRTSSKCTEEKYVNVTDCGDKIIPLLNNFIGNNNPLTKQISLKLIPPLHEFILKSQLKYSKYLKMREGLHLCQEKTQKHSESLLSFSLLESSVPSSLN